MLHILLVGLGCFFSILSVGMGCFGLWMPDTTAEKTAVLDGGWTFLVLALICFGLYLYL
ncbi:hypothetical protein [Chamaesiphon minutus]|uniref:Uncharacterized protein n=1 Tax=Chamaesiphon minutus (strain ATCC 27169 / PCC 6605) TaxID=1173020 RepID=K9UGR4_CHAP6|nr:hypothetical protein [Chamaesiphon minutus]AFY94282.1 hypothetical protein Cha6605_3275 [Chamaesiphon minutus PCC 6605]